MGDVGDALADYARVVDAAGFLYFEHMAVGMGRADVIAALEGSGLEPHDDAVDWYAFHNGPKPLAGDRYVELFDGVGPCTLEEALAHREIRLDGYLEHLGLDADEIDDVRRDGIEMPYATTWLPLSIGQETCVIDTGADHPPLLSLWDGESEARIRSTRLANWIAELTEAAAAGGLVWRDRVNAAGIDRAMFEFGSLTMLARFVPGLGALPERLRDYRSPRVVLRHPPVGSIPGNEGLELRQAEVVAEHLRKVVGLDLPIEYREGSAEAGRVVTVHIMAGYPDR